MARIAPKSGSNKIANRAIVFALLFIVVAIVVLGNTALLLFRGTKSHHVAVGFPIIIILIGFVGFAFG
jgi:hypothetical protein